uniref:NAD-dependent epimerase/dehydratase family protein n=2 Tax=Yoonia sp. TaxID=2212373 RepID=UPI0040475AEA
MLQKQKRILVLGGTGRVGRALMHVWPADLPTPVFQARAGGAYPWDMLSEPAPELPEDIVGIVALAGVTQGDDAALLMNTRLAQAACDLSSRAGGVRVLLASSQAVYGAPTMPVSEKSPTNPQTPYGQAKLMMERAVSGDQNTTCLRIGNVAGCDGLLLAAGRGSAVALDRFADGQGPQRTYIGPQVLARVLGALMMHPAPLPKVLNVGQPGAVAMADLLDAAAVPWRWRPAGARALRALDLRCDRLAGLVSLPRATPSGLIAQARAAGWPEGAVT